MLAKDWKETGFDIRVLTLPVSLDPYPFLCALLQEIDLRVDRYVVLGLAGHDARLAPGTTVDVDYHSPAMSGTIGLFGHP
jgi:hypothetical protein